MSSLNASGRPVTRDQSIELLRIIASYGIVVYHSDARFAQVGYAGLIVFLMLSPMVDMRYNWSRPRSAIEVAQLILIPWTFWMAVYGLKSVVLHAPIFRAPLPLGVLYGTSPHLWFLPFIFIVLVSLNAAKRRLSARTVFWTCAIAAAALLATCGIWRAPSQTLSLPLPQWTHAAPVVFVGVCLGLKAHVRSQDAVAGALLIALALCIAAAKGGPGIAMPYTVGILLSAATALVGSRLMPSTWRVTSVAECMLGVYLTHMLWLLALAKVTGPANHLTVFLAFSGALGSVWLARRLFPKCRIVLDGYRRPATPQIA